MHGFVMGLFYIVQSLASVMGAGLYAFSTGVLKWIEPNTRFSSNADLGEHMDYYFLSLGRNSFRNLAGICGSLCKLWC